MVSAECREPALEKKNPSQGRAQTTWRWAQSAANLPLKFPPTGKTTGNFNAYSATFLWPATSYAISALKLSRKTIADGRAHYQRV
jgi:hypothetical protein